MAESTLGSLSDRLGTTAHPTRLLGSPSVVITSITHDSRQVQPGAIFCCVPGASVDGHDFAERAVASGAVALLVERELPVAVPQLVVDDVRTAMGPLASLVYGRPSWPSEDSLTVVGVTGTNGKTTTVTLIAELLESLGVRTATIGTLTGVRTTPEAPELQAEFRRLADEGVDVAAIEVSSHALALHRVDGTWFAATVFTNIGLDHLDFHGTQERYFAAKALLFEPAFTDHGIVNLDDVHGRLLRDASPVDITGFSLDDLSDLRLDGPTAQFTWRGEAVNLPLAGRFNVSNALAAAETVRLLGHHVADIAAALATVTPPPGRFEPVDGGQPFPVIVDFAHTPDALENLLVAARELVDGGKLRVVFGCGGDRDESKRPQMGAVAADLADDVLVTSDNPRSEDPAAIIEAVKSGSPTPLASEPDRRLAVHSMLASARRGDVVVIAGKGHETTQTIGDVVTPFDDRVVAREWLTANDWGDA